MRENIGLYRGKRKDNGEWIEGSLLKVTISGETCYLIFGDDFAFDGNDVTALSHALVDPETIGECTSLPDKNGKLLFEGDIVRHYNCSDMPESYSIGRIFWDEKHCKFRRTSNTYSEIVDIARHCIYEVISNIHDNPELLEVSGDE